MKNLFILILLLLITIKFNAQIKLDGYLGGQEKLTEYKDVGISEITIGDSIVKVEPHFIKDAWLPNGEQIIKDGFGYRQYKMWGYTRRYYYQYGDANGPFYFYDSIGKIITSGECQNGEIQGNLYSYNENGNISAIEIYTKGKIISITKYYENGKVRSKLNYDNEGNRLGKYKEYYIDGKIKTEGQYALKTKCIYFDKDNLQIEMKSEPDVNSVGFPEGTWIEYFENGLIKKKEEYCGCYWYWGKNNLVKNSKNYVIIKDNCLCDKTTEFDINGKAKKTSIYKNCQEIIK